MNENAVVSKTPGALSLPQATALRACFFVLLRRSPSLPLPLEQYVVLVH